MGPFLGMLGAGGSSAAGAGAGAAGAGAGAAGAAGAGAGSAGAAGAGSALGSAATGAGTAAGGAAASGLGNAAGSSLASNAGTSTLSAPTGFQEKKKSGKSFLDTVSENMSAGPGSDTSTFQQQYQVGGAQELGSQSPQFAELMNYLKGAQ